MILRPRDSRGVPIRPADPKWGVLIQWGLTRDFGSLTIDALAMEIRVPPQRDAQREVFRDTVERDGS